MAKIKIRTRDVKAKKPLQVRTRDVKKPDPKPVAEKPMVQEHSNAATKNDVIRLQQLISKIPQSDLSPIEERLRNHDKNLDEIRGAITKKNAAKDYTFEIIRGSGGKITKVLAREGISEKKASKPEWPEFMDTKVKN